MRRLIVILDRTSRHHDHLGEGNRTPTSRQPPDRGHGQGARAFSASIGICTEDQGRSRWIMEPPSERGSVLVACPDARPPAYQAVIALNRAGSLRGFVTASYYDPDGRLASLARRHAPER